MIKPLVAIVGRPNVGKSTFFNKIIGKRVSIVEDTPGVTRDRIYADTEWCGTHFTVIDTGGLEIKSEDEMWSHIRRQAEVAVETADLVVFMVDGKQGLTHDDYDVADFLRKSNKPFLLVVNKIDNNEYERLYEFYQLGCGDPIGISAQQSLGIGDLLDKITENIKCVDIEADDDDKIKIAVVGKPNAGKSSIINRILGYDRVIVSDIAGTTRDAIDTPFTYKDKEFLLIDTAGLRRKSKIDENLEQYSVIRSLSAIRRADVVLVVFDSNEELSVQDIKIAGYVHEQGKPSVILMNKWDLVNKETNTVYKFNNKLKSELKFMDYYRALYISALTGKRTNNILSVALEVLENSKKRITTGLLNDVMHNALLTNEPPTKKGRVLKIYYATQVATTPPTFVVFVNDAKLIHFSYQRYLENCLRDAFDFSGTPIKLLIRNKNENEI